MKKQLAVAIILVVAGQCIGIAGALAGAHIDGRLFSVGIALNAVFSIAGFGIMLYWVVVKWVLREPRD